MEQSQALGATSKMTTVQVLPWHWGSLVGVFVFSAFTCTVFGQHTADVTWLLQVSERVLAGEQLYVDVRESNPPFSVALYLPFAALEQLTGLSSHLWTSFGLYGLLALSLSLVAHILKQGSTLSDTDCWITVLGLALISTVALPLQFAQREHFGIIAALPLLFLISTQVTTSYRPKAGLAIFYW